MKNNYSNSVTYVNLLTKINLVSLLELIKSEKFDELKQFSDDNPYVLQTLELLDVIVIISSDDVVKVSLTSLGSSILLHYDLQNSLKQQDSKLTTISTDLQRIKSSLSAISLDVIRSGGLAQENPYDSDFLLKKNEPFQGRKSSRGSKEANGQTSKISSSATLEDFKEYIDEEYQNMPPEEVQRLQKILNRIKKSYTKVMNHFQESEYQDFGLESFILVDSIFIFLLQFLEQKDPEILNKSLEQKYKLLSALPFPVDSDLIQFLDKVNTDILTNAPDPLTIGEKTAKRILNLLNNIYKPFITIFEVQS